MRPGHKASLAREQPHCAHLVGLDDELAVLGDAAHGTQIGIGFDEGLRGEHHLNARLRQFARQR